MFQPATNLFMATNNNVTPSNSGYNLRSQNALPNLSNQNNLQMNSNNIFSNGSNGVMIGGNSLSNFISCLIREFFFVILALFQ